MKGLEKDAIYELVLEKNGEWYGASLEDIEYLINKYNDNIISLRRLKK